MNPRSKHYRTQNMDELSLPKTKLILSDGVLKKFGKDNTVSATFPMESIKDIRCEKTTDYAVSILFFAICSSLGIIAKVFIPSPGWGWTAALICGFAACFSILMANGRRIILETNGGIVSYPVADGFEEAEGFAVSAKQKLELHSS